MPGRVRAKPGTYQIRPLVRRRNNTGLATSGRSFTANRAAAIARSIWPSRQSSRKNTGMNRSTVAIDTLPCMATTAGIPGFGHPGPQCDQRLAIVGRGPHVAALAGSQHDQPGRARDLLEGDQVSS